MDSLEFGLTGTTALQYFYMVDLSSGEIFLQTALDREVIKVSLIAVL